MAERNVFRKSSLEKLSNPDQLDQAVVISSPLSWLVLIGVALLIAATCIWAVFGTLPTTVSVTGVVANPQSACAVYADRAATKAELTVTVGTKIEQGTTVGKLTLSDGSTSDVLATQSGTVSDLLVTAAADDTAAQKIYPGTELLRYTPTVSNEQVVVCYVPVETAAKLQAGMKVLITPASAADKQLSGKILCIGEYPASSENTAYVLGGSDNYYTNQIFASGPVISVICTTDTNTDTISNGTSVSVKVITAENAPIEKLLTNLKSEG